MLGVAKPVMSLNVLTAVEELLPAASVKMDMRSTVLVILVPNVQSAIVRRVPVMEPLVRLVKVDMDWLEMIARVVLWVVVPIVMELKRLANLVIS